MSQTGLTPIRVAYMPLIDCAPLLAARHLGLDRAQGLELVLQRHSSWSAVRDCLLSGQAEAAHALAGFVYGIELGVAGPQASMALLMTLNHNGQAITLSSSLAAALTAGNSLREVLASLGRHAVFAQTFPTGTHALWLYYWLAASGIDPMHGIEAVTIPPPQMPQALAEGLVDGYCSGEPWAAVAEARQLGHRVIRSGQIWPGHPEKVLACRRDFAALQPELAERLTACVLAACRWLDEAPEHRQQCAQWLAEEAIVGVPAAQLAACLGDGSGDPTALAFHRGGYVNMPWLSDGTWFLSQFRRWHWCGPVAGEEDLLRNIHRLEIYRGAAARIGVPVPAEDRRPVRLFDQVGIDAAP